VRKLDSTDSHLGFAAIRASTFA